MPKNLWRLNAEKSLAPLCRKRLGSLTTKVHSERLSRRTYLSGPRVFGFTGVYRPFSRDAGVLAYDDLPAENAARLVNAWELDYQLPGYVNGLAGTPGGQLRKEIVDACKRSLEKGECAAAPGGQLLRNLSDCLAPRGARENERRVLRELIATGEHAIRNELATKLAANPPTENMTQRDLAGLLIPGATTGTQKALQASFAYEEAATALDYAFRRFLAYTTQQQGCMIDLSHALQTPGLGKTASRINALAQRAIDSVAELADPGLSSETAHALRLFERPVTPRSFLEAIIERHEEVQTSKKKLSWLDQIDGEWTVRVPYRNQSDSLNDEIWTHPMRVETLARFLRETA
ncbi:hypothetical protein GNZ11_35375 [Paraburkholderia xenovorans]|nr:hypothetical protein [Paraburkholderia xenovorans]